MRKIVQISSKGSFYTTFEKLKGGFEIQKLLLICLANFIYKKIKKIDSI